MKSFKWKKCDLLVTLNLHFRADVNAANSGTHWTPLHCAAFQGHGPVIMKLVNFGEPDFTLKDHRGRYDF